MTLMERMKEANMGPDAKLKGKSRAPLGEHPRYIYQHIPPIY